MNVERVIKYLFAFPYLGGILVIASFVIPVVSDFDPNWYGNNSYSFWMWGLLGSVYWYLHGTWYWETIYSFTPYIFTLILGLICSVVIIFFAVKTVLAARRFGNEEKFLDSIFVKYSAIILSITFIWMIITEIFHSIIGFIRYDPAFSFWGHFNMQFGLIGIFLGASLSIAGYLLTKLLLKRYDYLFYKEED